MEPLDDNAALIIIDMQKGVDCSWLGRRNNPDAAIHIGELLASWRRTLRPVVHVRHISRSSGSVFRPGQPGCEFQESLTPLEHEHVVEKNVPDAFAASGLERWLLARSIRQVVIVGVATNNSVESTARTGGNLGFDVLVVADATYTFDLIDLAGRSWPAEDVHVLSLSNLAIDYARVIEAADLLIAV